MYYEARHIERAKNVAMSNNQAFHLAAILFRKKRVVRIGANSGKTHPKYHRVYDNGEEGSHLHAEMNVLRFSQPGDIITVIRWNAAGKITMAKPCSHCQGFLRAAGIERVIYSDWDGNFKTMRIEY